MQWRFVALVLVAVGAVGDGGCSCDNAREREVDAAMERDAAADAAVDAPDAMIGPRITYVKASNTERDDWFGSAVAVSADGNTVAISASEEDSGAIGINGTQTTNTHAGAGAVYVFVRSGGLWVQQAYVKASNTGALYSFGGSLALSGDGNTLAVGSYAEKSASTGINQSQNDDNLPQAGAVYVFTRNAGTWTQQAYVKASNTNAYDAFGSSVTLSGDGNTLAVGAHWEESSATGVDGDQMNNDVILSGAVYVFGRTNTTWTHRAYLKASNTQLGGYFGGSIALSADASTLAVGSFGEASCFLADPLNRDCVEAGAVYVFRQAAGLWSQEAYLKAPHPSVEDRFGGALALSSTGSTLAVGAATEDSAARGIGGDPQDEDASNSGAIFVFERSVATWSAPTYIKSSRSDAGDLFGTSLALAASGDTLIVGAPEEDGASQGYGGDPASNAASNAGAVFMFTRSAGGWAETSYLKAPNGESPDHLGFSLAVSATATTIVAGGVLEASSATGVGGDGSLDDAAASGAAYVFEP
jgi:hypothetical protein